ncbi:MAG: hypothetical protein COB98_07870, partial [Flavobacteriaceae bacterium]
MKKGLLFLLFILTVSLSYGQAKITGHTTYTQAEINAINNVPAGGSTAFSAGEGDLYQVNETPNTPATATTTWYIGLSDGSLKLLSNDVTKNGDIYSFVNSDGMIITFDISGISDNATAIALKENSANKSTDVNLADTTDTKFPTEKAVKTYVDAQILATADDDITSATLSNTSLLTINE